MVKKKNEYIKNYHNSFGLISNSTFLSEGISYIQMTLF